MSALARAVAAARRALSPSMTETVSVLGASYAEVGPGESPRTLAPTGATFRAAVQPLTGADAVRAGQEASDEPVRILAAYGDATAALSGSSVVRWRGADYDCRPPADLAAQGGLVEILATRRGSPS